MRPGRRCPLQANLACDIRMGFLREYRSGCLFKPDMDFFHTFLMFLFPNKILLLIVPENFSCDRIVFFAFSPEKLIVWAAFSDSLPVPD